MKIVYVGKCNSLASTLVNRFVKEGEEIYLISQKDFEQEIKPSLKYKLYKYRSDDLGLDKIFSSIKPEIVIFAGDHYLQEKWEHSKSTNAYLSELLNILNISSFYKVQKFIYLSTNEVYPVSENRYKEEDKKRPSTYKGELCHQGEELVLQFHHLRNIEAVILRMESIFGCSINEDEQDFLSNIVESFYLNEQYSANTNRVVCPLYIQDCVEAIFRAKDITPSLIYNVGSMDPVNEAEIVDLLNYSFEDEYQVIKYDGHMNSNLVDSSKIKSELEWFPHHNFKTILLDNKVDLRKKEKYVTKEKKKRLNTNILLLIENVIIFFIFAFLTTVLQNHSVFNTTDLMIVYVIIMAVLLGVRQSILSVILASMFYIIRNNGFQECNIMNILTNVKVVFQIAQYIFIGAAIGYSVDHYRSIIKEKNIEYEYLNREYEEIKEINNDNVKIKHEYEKRILNYKTSLPQLYSLVNKLIVLEPEKIFVEVIDVIKNIMDTDTVAFYLGNKKNNFFRLISSSNIEAIFKGKSINLDEYPKMRDTLYNDEVFIGSQWDDIEPSMAAPIFYKGKCIGVIIINKMKFSNLTLYQMNLFRTLSSLITSSIVKAKNYEELTRTTQYIEGTDILKKNEFTKLIDLKKESKNKGKSDYSIIKFITEQDIKDTYYKIVNYFRATDYFGINSRQELFVLLSNTSIEEAGYVLNRLKNEEIEAEIVGV